MWIKIGQHRINMDNVTRYYPNGENYKRDITFMMVGQEPSYGSGPNGKFEARVNLSASKVCEYLDNLIISGKDEDTRMLVIDKEFEEHIKDVEFKTMEEFKEVK